MKNITRSLLAFAGILLFVSPVSGDEISEDYMARLGRSASYEVFKELHSEVFAREDLSLEQKKAISDGIVNGWNANVEAEGNAEIRRIWTRGAIAMGLKGLGNQVWMPGFLGGALDAWGDGVLEEKSAGETTADIMVGASTGALTPIVLKKGGKLVVQLVKKNQSGKLIVDKVVAFSDDVSSKVVSKIENSEAGQLLFRNIGKARSEIRKELMDEADRLSSEYKDLLRKPNKSLSESELAKKNEVIERILTNKQEARLIKSGPTDEQITRENIRKDLGYLAKTLGFAIEEKTGVNPNLAEGAVDYLKEKAVRAVIDKVVSTVDNCIYGRDTPVLVGGVEENVYIDNSTGDIIQIDDAEVPADIFNTLFADNPAEPKDAQTLANEAFNKEIDKIVKDVADGDQSLADKMKDFVKGKIEEAIKKGEDWIENGGIRDSLKDQIGKMLDGKVSDTDKQRIMNLTDGLCNVGKDGGKTLVEALGNDGVPLAESLALNELKKQIASALPAEDAAHVNALIDTLNSGATTAEKRALMLAELQKLVSEKIPYENSAKAVNDIIQTIADGKAVDVLDSVKNVGNAIAIDALKDVISKSLDPETAAKLNALLDGYAANGIKGLDDALMAQIDALIDKAAPGKDSAEKLKRVYHGLKDGTITAKDVKDAATATVADGAKALIDKSNLPDAVKEAAKAAIDGLAEDGFTGLTKNMEEYIHSQVEAALGKDAADAVTDIIDAVVTPGKDPWEAIEKNADKIGEAIKEKIFKEVENLAEKQLNKLIDKFPALKNVLGNLGLDAKGIIQGIKNIFGVLANAPDLTTTISQLSQMAASFLKDIAAKLINWALEWAVSWLNDFLIPKVMDWTSSTLGKWASSTGNPRIKAGLEWLQSQVSNCKKCARIKIKTKGTGAKVISKIDAMIEKKKKSGEKVLEGSTKR